MHADAALAGIEMGGKRLDAGPLHEAIMNPVAKTSGIS